MDSGAKAGACHELGSAAWNESDSEVVVPFGPSNLPAGTTTVEHGAFGEGCKEPQPAGLAVVKAGVSSEFSPSGLIAPAPACSYESAVFDSEGILAVEGCSEGAPTRRAPAGPFGSLLGQAYLVQLTATGEVTRRLRLAIGASPAAVARDPETGTILVSDNQEGEVKPHWVWNTATDTCA